LVFCAADAPGGAASEIFSPREALRNLTDACSAIKNAIDLMQLVVGNASA
jgi:hypothetical protein